MHWTKHNIARKLFAPPPQGVFIMPIRVAIILGLLALLYAVASPAQTCSATLSWTPPTKNTDGSALTNLAGYRVLYGSSSTTLTSTVQLSNPALSSYIVDALGCGPTYYFVVKAYTTTGAESANSNIASKTTQPLPVYPAPPAGLSIVATAREVYQVIGTVNKFQFLPVGTAPAGTLCITTQRINEYFAVPTAVVTWYGSVKPKIVVAKCNS